MRTAFGDMIHAVLRKHRGVENAITAPQLADELGMFTERDIRAIIAAEFREWIPESGLLCSLPGKGFFFATEAEEIVRKQRVLIALKLEAAAKLADFHDGMRRAGFGGLVTDRIPETFTNASQPNQAEDRKRRDAA